MGPEIASCFHSAKVGKGERLSGHHEPLLARSELHCSELPCAAPFIGGSGDPPQHTARNGAIVGTGQLLERPFTQCIAFITAIVTSYGICENPDNLAGKDVDPAAEKSGRTAGGV